MPTIAEMWGILEIFAGCTILVIIFKNYMTWIIEGVITISNGGQYELTTKSSLLMVALWSLAVMAIGFGLKNIL